jgi:hypothetical protein
MSFLPEKEGEAKYFDNFIITRKSSSHETDKIVVSLKHKVRQFLSIVHFFIDPSVFSNVHTIYGMILSMILLAFGKHFHDRIMSVRRKF